MLINQLYRSMSVWINFFISHDLTTTTTTSCYCVITILLLRHFFDISLTFLSSRWKLEQTGTEKKKKLEAVPEKYEKYISTTNNSIYNSIYHFSIILRLVLNINNYYNFVSIYFFFISYLSHRSSKVRTGDQDTIHAA